MYKTNNSMTESSSSESSNILLRRKRGSGFFMFVSIMVVGFVLFAAYNVYQSPKEIVLKQENEKYRVQLERLNLKIDNMSQSLNAIVGRDDSIYRVVYEATPIPAEQRQVGFGGSDRYVDLKGFDNSDLIISTAAKLDMLGRQLYVEYKSLDEVSKIAKLKVKMLASIPAIQPVSINDFHYISSPFGYRSHPKNGHWKKHEGIDIVAPYGAPIYATGDGVVEYPSSSMYGYGKVVVINHGFGYQSLYAHMSKKAIKPGNQIKRGQLIGYVGNTGISTGTHLHYEVIKNGLSLNPKNYFFNDLTQWEYITLVNRAKL